MQGLDTDPKAVTIIREAIKTGTECTVRILNYRCHTTPVATFFSAPAILGC